jgi:hypothetical protein
MIERDYMDYLLDIQDACYKCASFTKDEIPGLSIKIDRLILKLG